MSDEMKDVRLPVMVSRSEADAIDDWRFKNRIATRAEAIRTLIQRGLGASEQKAAPRRAIGALALSDGRTLKR